MVHRFGTFELDERRFELKRRGKPVPLPRKVLETIIYLVNNRDRLISKEELLAGPWKGTAVTDGALNRSIMLARKALQDQPGRKQIIKTVRGKGFRFLADVTQTAISEATPGTKTPPSNAHTRRSPLPQALFLGRDSELEAISRAVETAVAGRGSVVLVGGEPGIGKTSLMQALAARIDGAEVLWGRCWEGEGAPAFWPWLEILRGYLERHGKRAVALMGQGVADIAQLLPELSSKAAPAASFTDPDSPQARFRAFDSIARFLHRAASSSPLVLFIDDLHAADDPSILLLQFLARTIEGTPLVVVASYRDLEVSSRPILASFLGGPIGGALRVTLSGLSEDDVGALLLSRLQRSVPSDLARRIRDTTDGNPFLVSELAGSLSVGSREGRLDLSEVDSFRMPNRVVDVVRRHLGRLPPHTVEMLNAASVVGREFSLSVLGDMRASSPEQVAGDLDPALLDGFIRSSVRRPGTYIFSHSLLRETVYQLLPITTRIALHFSAGAALERRRTSDAMESSVALQIAQHYFAAIPEKGTAKALEWALKAAAHAVRLLAYEIAIEQYEHAVKLLNLAGGGEQRLCETMLLLGETQRLAGQAGQAMATFAGVESIARQQGSAELLARALVGCVDVLRDGAALQESLAYRLEEALKELPDVDSTLRARVLAAIPIAGFLQPEMAERLGPYYEQAVDIATRLGETGTLATVLHTAHWRMMSDGTSREKAMVAATEMMEVARRANHHEKVLDGHLWRSYHLLSLGRGSQFEIEIREHARLAKRVRDPFHLWFVQLADSTTARMAGRWREADALAEKAFETGVQVQGPVAQSLFLAQMLNSNMEKESLARAGALGEIARTFRDLMRQLPPLPILRAGLALAELETESRLDAQMAFEHLVDVDLARVPPDQNLLPLLVILGRLAASFEDAARATVLYEHLAPHLGHHVVLIAVADYWGPVSNHLGGLAATSGRRDLANQHFESATAESLAIGAPIWQAWAQYERAILLRTTHDKQAACRRDLLRTALVAAKHLRLERLHNRAERALSQAP